MSDEEKSKEQTDQTQDEVKEIPPQDAGEKVPEKISLTQKELDGKLADARRKAEAKLREVEEEYKSFKQTVEQREQAANDAAAEKVEALRKDLPESITKLLDKLTPIEQLDWLNDPENAITKKQIPELPTSQNQKGSQRKTKTIV